MENKEKNNKETNNKKAYIFFSLIILILLMAALFYPIISDKLDSNPVVVYTLSKKQNDERGQTTKAELSDNNMREADGTIHITGTEPAATVPDSSISGETCVTVIFPLDVNSASVEELMMVRGIGEITANKIVEYRGINGYFYSMDELLNVDGIGKKKLAGLKGYLCIDYASLPETLPDFGGFSDYDAAEKDEITTTTVPMQYINAAATSVMTSATTEDFVMETEEFITGTDDEIDTEELYSEYTYFESYDMFETPETEYYPNFPLELNSCSAKDLTYIKGIGESTADKIVEYARTIGFMSVDDLLNVNGIGQSKLETIRPYVYVVPSGTVSAPVNNETEFSDTETTSVIDTEPEIYKVNINSCVKSDLTQLPGIDEALADAILEFRNTIGYFQNIEELSFVISNEQLSKIWDYVYV
ncbi:MAG: helix-hairpin-helix domain-containing protein [Eubacterium sp.]|nr:helix-hairpin-helix domain-containing protein [Eubacterium sp.]